MNKKMLIRKYIDGFLGYISPTIHLNKGLFTKKVARKDGKSIHLQLRIKEDKSGILFLDLTDVLHINKSAALIFKLIIDKKSPHFAYTYIKRKFKVENREKLREEIALISNFYAHLANDHSSCFVCKFIDNFKKVPIFSENISAPYKIDLALTYGCNNACSHCYNEKNRLAMPSLSKIDWFKVIDKLVYEGIPHLILTGGEASLHPDLPEIIEYSDKKGMVVGLNTNGRRLASKQYMDLLRDKGLNHVQVTLGSHITDVHNTTMNSNSFEQTVAGIKNAITSGVHVITNTTIVQQNKEQLPDLILFLNDLGIQTFAMNGLIYSGGGSEMGDAIPEYEVEIILSEVRSIAKKYGMKFLWYSPTEYCRINPIQLDVGVKRCNAGEYSVCIEPNGNILPCQSYYFATGNLMKDNWESIWDHNINSSFRGRAEDLTGDFLPEYCFGCPTLAVCGGGCKIERDSGLRNDAFDSLVIQTVSNEDKEKDVFYPSEGMVKTKRASGIDKRKY